MDLWVFKVTAHVFDIMSYFKKSVNIPMGQSESVHRRRTDNEMAKRKTYKTTNNDLQNIQINYRLSNRTPRTCHCRNSNKRETTLINSNCWHSYCILHV